MKKSEITDQELLRRIELAEQQQASEIAKGGFYHDPIEDDPEMARLSKPRMTARIPKSPRRSFLGDVTTYGGRWGASLLRNMESNGIRQAT
jgi:hypothetical protein